MTTYITATAPFVSDTAAHYIAWGQAIGKGFTAVGWTATSGHGELVASGTGNTYAWTNIIALPGTTVVTCALRYTFKGAWQSGATYVGGNASSSLCDLVTDGGLTYVHITASSNSATAPGADATNWMPYNYEIWTNSGGTLGSVLPIYIRIVYVKNASPATGVSVHVAIGTGVDADGNLINAMPLTSIAPTTNCVHSPTGTISSTSYSHMFSGDTNNIRFAAWKDYNVTSASQMLVVFVDYARLSNGSQSSAYAMVGTSIMTGATCKLASAVFMSSTYGGGVLASNLVAWPTLGCNTTSYMNFGATVPLPIFPMIGYLANPTLGAVCFPWADCVEGAIQPVWMYGASHNFLVLGNINLLGGSPNGISNSCKPAILWE